MKAEEDDCWALQVLEELLCKQLAPVLFLKSLQLWFAQLHVLQSKN